MKGINLDWESGWGNNITCHQELWGKAVKTFRKHGKELALSIDDSKAIPFNRASTNWSFETDWGLFKGYADVFINMGTYPGKWSKGISWPAWQYVESYSCADAPACAWRSQSNMRPRGANSRHDQVWGEAGLPAAARFVG